MSKNFDIIVEFPGLTVVHQKIPAREVDQHQHSLHEFFLPLQGEITVEYSGHKIKAGPGHILYVPPNVEHKFSSSAKGSGERVIWLIDEKVWKMHIKENFNACIISMNSLVKELIFYLLIHPDLRGIKYFISVLVESLGESLLSAELNSRKMKLDHMAGKVVDPRIIKSIEIIESEFNTSSLKEVSEKSGLSSRNFNRLFLQEVGIAPKDYLILCRINKAKDLIKNTRLTITDISLEVGYGSLSKFIAVFKKHEGVLPSDFRKLRLKG